MSDVCPGCARPFGDDRYSCRSSLNDLGLIDCLRHQAARERAGNEQRGALLEYEHSANAHLITQLSTAKKRIRELELEVELYRKGYAARGQILVAYRTGRQPIGKALADAADVQKKLGLISNADTKGEGMAESGAHCEACHGSGSAPLVPMSTCATCFGSGKAPPK